MEKQEATRYFCPFAREACLGGVVDWDDDIPEATCQFWNSGSSRCDLRRGISALGELHVIGPALNSLPDVIGRLKFR